MPATRSPRRSSCALEALEPRTLLATTTALVTVYHDVNLNRRRDAGEPAMRGFTIWTRVDEAGVFVTRSARTDAHGRASLSNSWIPSLYPQITVNLKSNGYWCTTHPTYVADVDFNAAQRGRGRVALSIGVADRGAVPGGVNHVIAYPNGTTATVPLSGRRVFEDANGNGKFDRGEPSAVTDEKGAYRITLRAGTRKLRVQPRPGWRAATPGSDAVRGVASPGARTFPTASVQMDGPTTIDVLAVYTPAARGALSKSRMSARVTDLFNSANAIYGNSDTNVLLNPVRIDGTSYTESGSLETDLQRLKETRDSFMDEVHRTRNAVRADLAVLLTEKSRSPGGTVGVGYQYHPHAQQQILGFSAVALTGDAAVDPNTLAHEIGHNLGAGHEPGVDEGEPTKPYAQGYVSWHSSVGSFNDVMSHAQGRTLPFFSSPRIETSFGAIFGNAATADNARIIREVAPVVARYR